MGVKKGIQNLVNKTFNGPNLKDSCKVLIVLVNDEEPCVTGIRLWFYLFLVAHFDIPLFF